MDQTLLSEVYVYVQYKRPLAVILDGSTYGFNSSSSNSKLTITLNGYCSIECDLVWIFGTKTQYFSFAVGFDNVLSINGYNEGIFIFPSPNSALHDGYFIDDIANSNEDDLFDMTAGNDQSNWYRLVSESHGAVNTSTMAEFVIINDDINDNVYFNFYSSKYPNGLSVIYNQSFDTDQDFHFGILIDDATNEILTIESLDIYKDGESTWQWATKNVTLMDNYYSGAVYIPYTQNVYWFVHIFSLRFCEDYIQTSDIIF